MDKHKAENLTELTELVEELVEEAGGNQITFPFQDRFAEPWLIFHDEDGDLCYAVSPTDDPDDAPVGYLSKVFPAWPLTRLVPMEALS